MKFTVGGESFDLTAQEVIAAIRGVPVEAIREHVVEIDGRMFPPSRSSANVARAARQSFTTMEAQRVLRRVGFVCRRAGQADHDSNASARSVDEGRGPRGPQARLADIESALGTVQAAIAGLHKRVNDLEATR